MIRKEIRPGLWYIGEANEKMRTLRYSSFTEEGMMYNSYLMNTEEGYLLVGTVPKRYVEIWLKEIRDVVGTNNIAWAILFGTDEDRFALNALLKEWQNVIVIADANGLYKLEGFVDSEYDQIKVCSKRKLMLGERELCLIPVLERFATPSLYVFEEEEHVLFTADAFNSVYASNQILVSQLMDKESFYRGVRRHYFDIQGEQRAKTMGDAIRLMQEYDVSLICPAYGPVVDEGFDRLMDEYVPAQKHVHENPVLAVIYTPGNYVSELAEYIISGVRDSGKVEVRIYNLCTVNRDEVLREIVQCDAFLFGTPEIQCDAAKSIWDIATSLTKQDCEGKLAAVFVSTGSQGSAAENLRQRLAMLGCNLSMQDYQIRGKPDIQMLKNSYEYGFSVGCSIQKIPNPHKPALVKCLVCGEVFDASLGICPVCGVGLEQCVPEDSEEVAFRNDTESRYVIVGGGVAAVSAAEAIRKRDATGSIAIFSAENHLPINRPMLTKDMFAATDTILIHEMKWYEEKKITLHLGCYVNAIDAQGKTITTDAGEICEFDKLIYAAGAECFMPPFEGHDKEGVLTIRHLSNIAMLKASLKTVKNAVIIGGGAIGLETANELIRCGLWVTVLEAAPQIIGRQIDAEMAAVFRKRMESMHVKCYEGVTIARIEGEKYVTGVRLADGRLFPADIVIVSCGNRSNIRIAKEAGILADRAVVVNERMETSAADVYACGDCAQFDSVNYQLWQEASEQGRIAGANAVGDKICYKNPVMGLSLEGFGSSLFAIGDAGKKQDIPYKTVETRDDVTGRHEKYWFYGNSLQGAVLIGAPEKVVDVTRAVTVHAQYKEIF